MNRPTAKRVRAWQCLRAFLTHRQTRLALRARAKSGVELVQLRRELDPRTKRPRIHPFNVGLLGLEFRSRTTERLLGYVILCAWVWERSGLVISRELWAKLLRCSLTTVDRAIATLECAGMLRVKHLYAPNAVDAARWDQAPSLYVPGPALRLLWPVYTDRARARRVSPHGDPSEYLHDDPPYGGLKETGGTDRDPLLPVEKSVSAPLAPTGSTCIWRDGGQRCSEPVRREGRLCRRCSHRLWKQREAARVSTSGVASSAAAGASSAPAASAVAPWLDRSPDVNWQALPHELRESMQLEFFERAEQLELKGGAR